MKEISIRDFEGLKIGSAENVQAATGCTVFLLGENGAPVGLMCAAAAPPAGKVSCSTRWLRHKASMRSCFPAAVPSGWTLPAA